MYYEELQNGHWRRIDIEGEALSGRPHHVIYFGSKQDWKKGPAWAHDRRKEIISRIKSVFRIPDYEYEGEDVLDDTDSELLIDSAGDLSTRKCIYSGCRLFALKGKAVCVRHSRTSYYGDSAWQ
ncbi:MAG: hypothetical protein AB1705_11280 [Verrucomicrobiota bacterium]